MCYPISSYWPLGCRALSPIIPLSLFVTDCVRYSGVHLQLVIFIAMSAMVRKSTHLDDPVSRNQDADAHFPERWCPSQAV